MAPLAPSKVRLASKPQKNVSRPTSTSSAPPKPPPKSSVASLIAKRKVTTTKALAPRTPDSEEDEEEILEDHERSEGEEQTHLQGFSTDEDSSDDDGDDAPEIPGVDISKLPTVAKDDATVKRKLERAKRDPVSVFVYAFAEG